MADDEHEVARETEGTAPELFAGLPDEPDIARLDREGLHALAHPLRSRLLGALRLHGPATATGLAHRLGTNSGATSYHLRQLAAVGLVEEDPELGTARERWWRSAHRGTRFTDTEFMSDPDDRAAADWLVRHFARLRARWLEDWLDVRQEWPQQWRNAADQSDFWLTLPPERLAELNREVYALVERYRRESDPEAPGAERVVAQWHSFPYPEPTL